MKKLISFLVSAVMLLCVSAEAEIYTYDETEEIMNGVTLRHMRRFYGDSWLNINVVSADLKEPNVKLDLLKGTSCDSLTSMSGLTSSQENVVAASNADFFDNTRPKYSQGFALGIEIKDGELLQSQVNESMAAAFYDGTKLDLSYMSMTITLTAPNGSQATVRHLNKHTDYYGDILMYTSDWNNGYSPAPGGEVVEVVVDNGIVTEFRRNMPSVLIPENGYVLVVSEGVNMFLANNFQVGDTIDLSITATPSLDNVKTAFGGGTLLLKDGQRAASTHTISGRQPRTCIGTSADGTVVYIITVDGRQSSSRGVTQDELASLAAEVGCANAMNLDGGGSTRFMAKTFWNSELHVVNSPTENRKVINAVAITSDAAAGEAVGVRLRTSTDAIIVGDSLSIESRFYDENGNAVWVYDEEPQWVVEGVEGSVTNGVFTPSSGGTAKITSVYKGNPSEPVYVNVISEADAVGINLPRKIELDAGESYTLAPEVFTADGTTAAVSNTALLRPTVENLAVAGITGNTLTGSATGCATLSLAFGNAASYSLIEVGTPSYVPDIPQNVTSADPLQGKIDGGNSFGVFAYSGSTNTLIGNLIYGRGLSGIGSSDSYGFLGTYNASLLPSGMRTPIAANSFSAIDKGFALVISLPSSGRLSGSNWISMANALASTSAKNVIVLTNAMPNGSTAEETELFYDYFEFIAESKNVFVVQSSDADGVCIRGGVRYLSLADAAQSNGMSSAVERASVLRFTTDGESCMYSFEKLFG